MYIPRRRAKKRICPICNGEKKVTVIRKNNQKELTICPRCNGEGLI